MGGQRGAIRVGFTVLPGRYEEARTWEGLTPSCLSPGPPGVKQAPNHPRVENGNMGTASCPPVDTGYPWRPAKGMMRDGALVLVRGRESRPHGEGGQEAEAF